MSDTAFSRFCLTEHGSHRNMLSHDALGYPTSIDALLCSWGPPFCNYDFILKNGGSFSKELEHHAWCLIVFLANETAHQISFYSAKFVIIMGVGSPSLMQFHFQTMH